MTNKKDKSLNHKHNMVWASDGWFCESCGTNATEDENIALSAPYKEENRPFSSVEARTRMTTPEASTGFVYLITTNILDEQGVTVEWNIQSFHRTLEGAVAEVKRLHQHIKD